MSSGISPDDLIDSKLRSGLAQEVKRHAERSTLTNYKTGAVIFNDNGIAAYGTSHTPLYTWLKDKRSVHAEDDALAMANRKFDTLKRFEIVIYTVSKTGNLATSSRPCYGCALRLLKADLKAVHYLERVNDGTWLLNSVEPARLVHSVRAVQ